MIVKRGAFLLLTSALAHQACTVETVDDDDDGGEAGSTSGGTDSGGKGGKGGSAGSGTGGTSGKGGAAGSGGSGPSGAGGEDATAGEGPSAGEAGSGGSAGEAQGGQGGEAPATGGEGGAGTSCDDSVGTPGDCSALDATDCSWELSYCTAAGMYLKPKVAEEATECMLTDPACLTSGIDPYGCVRTALAGACLDTTKDTFCAGAIVACGPAEDIDTAGCHALVDGLNQDGLALVQACVDAGCSFGLWSCVEGVQ